MTERPRLNVDDEANNGHREFLACWVRELVLLVRRQVLD